MTLHLRKFDSVVTELMRFIRDSMAPHLISSLLLSLPSHSSRLLVDTLFAQRPPSFGSSHSCSDGIRETGRDKYKSVERNACMCMRKCRCTCIVVDVDVESKCRCSCSCSCMSMSMSMSVIMSVSVCVCLCVDVFVCGCLHAYVEVHVFVCVYLGCACIGVCTCMYMSLRTHVASCFGSLCVHLFMSTGMKLSVVLPSNTNPFFFSNKKCFEFVCINLDLIHGTRAKHGSCRLPLGS